jgi:hypothetical protein
VISLKSVASFVVILAASLALLIPLALFAPPRDSEVWLFQTIHEMQDQQRFLPVLNNAPLQGNNPLTLMALSTLTARDISSQRLTSCFMGCIFIAFVFFFSFALFDLSSALVSCLVAITSLGFLALFGTLNLTALPVTFAAAAFGFFSLIYIKRLHSGLYILSYLLAALAAITGGYFMLLFFIFGVVLLILLDLEPSELFSIHILPGVVIVACAIIAYLVSFRIALGAGLVGKTLSPGGHLGLFKGIYAIITYASPWIFLVIPAWIHGGGPSDKDTWRTLLPVRIAVIMGFVMLWFSSSCLPQYATILVVFSSPLIGCWISRGIFSGSLKSSLGFWLMVLAGLTVFVYAFVLLLLPLFSGYSMDVRQIIAVAGFVAAALLFIFFTVKRTMAAQFILIVLTSVFIAGYISFLSPKDQWNHKISYMENISRNTPLAVYEDDLVMRGYMSAIDVKPLIIDRNSVPLHEIAFLAVSTSDLEGMLDDHKGHMHSVVIDSYRAENTYALLMISPNR